MSTQLLLIDSNLSVSIVNLSTTLKVEPIGNIAEMIEEGSSGKRLRSYDKLINFIHFNPSTGHLFVSLLNLNSFVMIDTQKKELVWNLPRMDSDIPLCAHSDQDKLIVCYDSNKVVVFDLLNRKLHDWSKRNSERLPQNFLNRFNRIIGITAINESKFILYTNYTYIVLDLTQDAPRHEVSIV